MEKMIKGVNKLDCKMFESIEIWKLKKNDVAEVQQTDNYLSAYLINHSTANRYFSKMAFTLSEVLITLGVIGVVSAMTLPTLIKNYQKHVAVNRLKTAYSQISQAIKMSEIDNGPATDWDASQTYSSRFAKKYFLPYLKTKETTVDNCKNLQEHNCYMLTNGVSVVFWERDGFIDIRLDINGKQRPNSNGKDVFLFILPLKSNSVFIGYDLPKGRLYFRGEGFSNVKSKCKLEKYYCGALIIQNSWQIPDDYPW